MLLNPSTPDLEATLTDKPLFNPEVEEAILGGILLDPEAIGRIADELPAEAFYSSQHQDIYNAAIKLHREGFPTDMVGVAIELTDTGKLEGIGGQTRLAQLLERCVSAVNIDRYAALVAEKYLRRLLLDHGLSTAKIAGQTDIDLPDALHQVAQSLKAVETMRPADKPVPMSELAQAWHEDHEQRLAGLIPDPRLKTNFYDLDDLLGGGFRPSGQLVGIVADTGCGKTTFGLQVAWEIAKQTDDPVVVFSLEMEKGELIERLMSRVSGVPSQMISNPNISPDQYAKVIDAYTELSERSNFFVDDRAETLSEMRATLGAIARENGGKIGAVLVDYFQLVKPEGNPRASKVEQLVSISQELKRMTRPGGFDTTIIVLAQIGRDAVKNRSNKRPTKHDTEWCGAFEKDVNTMLGLYHDENYDPETVKRGITEVSVLKNRSGQDGPGAVVELLYERQCTRFKNKTNYALSRAPIPQPQALPA